MKLVVFSDAHGNIYALKEFLKKIELLDYDRLIFCGDIFGYYYNQREVFDTLKSLDNLIWIKGNHDDYFVKVFNGLMSKGECIKKYGHSYELARKEFSQEEIEFLDGLEAEYTLHIGGCKIGIFHGTPEDSLEGRLYPDNEIQAQDIYTNYDIVILGHTHCRMQRYEGDTLIVNSGSLGQPRDGEDFGFAIIDTDEKAVEFQSVFFDKKELYNQIDKYDFDLAKLKEVIERRKK